MPLMQQVVISWPFAAAVVASVVTATLGIVKLYSNGRAQMSLQSLHDDQEKLRDRVASVEREVSVVSTSVEGQMKGLRRDVERVERKVDKLVNHLIEGAQCAPLPIKGK
jgi:hypothetical protein